MKAANHSVVNTWQLPWAYDRHAGEPRRQQSPEDANYKLLILNVFEIILLLAESNGSDT